LVKKRSNVMYEVSYSCSLQRSAFEHVSSLRTRRERTLRLPSDLVYHAPARL
jgi:hypothetical protein